MNKAKTFLHTIFENADLGPLSSEQHQVFVLFWGGLLLSIISAVLTIFNVVLNYWFMAITTACLTIGFGVACGLAQTRHFTASRWLMAALCAFNFSLYALTGENEGFAILWILLIPILSMLLLGLKTGFFLSAYFQVFLIVLFYTPLSAHVAGFYTSTFLMRFPVLYLTSFAVVLFLMCQRQKLYQITSEQATHDNLTGLYNRHKAQQLIKEYSNAEKYPKLSVVAIDINRLKWTNDNLGHEAGDELIAGTADLIRASFPDDCCFRMGGDEFMALCERDDVTANIEHIRALMREWRGHRISTLTLSLGAASRAEFPEAAYEELSKKADERMYLDKAVYYQQNNIDRRK